MSFTVPLFSPGHAPVSPAAGRFPAARFAAAPKDTFTPRFGGKAADPDDGFDQDAYIDAVSAELDALITEMEALDEAYYHALDAGDCDRAREIMAEKDKLEDQLADDGELPSISNEQIVDMAMAAYEQHRKDQDRGDMEWDSLLLETGLVDLEPGAAMASEEAPTSLRDEQRELSLRLVDLSQAVDKAVQDGNDGEAMLLYDELKHLREERRALGD